MEFNFDEIYNQILKEKESCKDPCGICYKELNKKTILLKCKHRFHYECLLKTFRHTRNACPYCRKPHLKLPLVNGIKKTELKVCRYYFEGEYPNNVNNYISTTCKYVLKRGKNKGSLCGKHCKLGYDYCSSHC